MEKVPVYFWCEPIDNDFVACHARMRVTQRGYVYGATAFAIVERHRVYEWHPEKCKHLGVVAAESALRAFVTEKNFGRLPILCSKEFADQLGVA